MAEGTRDVGAAASDPRPAVIGWDIGGVNTKAARIDTQGDVAAAVRTASVAYEIQHDPAALASTLTALAVGLGRHRGCAHAVTMTAELSQAFRTKRDGVGFVLDALEAAFPDDALHVYTVDGSFVTPAAARAQPLAVGASNWAATAACIARDMPNGILVDIGTTSTDIIPILAGRVAALGRTDPARLLTGELVYTGAVRTPAEALVRAVPLWGGHASVSAEGFATIGDAHVWLGRLDPGDYTAPTADGRPATREFAGERLARVVCADREMLDTRTIDGIARSLAESQLELVAAGIRRVRAAFPETPMAMVAGLGEFIAAEAVRRVGLTLVPLAARLSSSGRTAPAAAVAWLLADELSTR